MAVGFDIKWAQTLDGQLCDDSQSSKWISGEEERLETHKIRADYDAVLVGARTFTEDLAKLTVRMVPLKSGKTQPARIIVDPRDTLAKSLVEAKVADRVLNEILSNKERETIVITKSVSTEIYSKYGLKVRAMGDYFESPQFVERLARAISNVSPGIQKILVEGGARLLTQFLVSGNYGKAYVSVSQKITGGNKNRVTPDKRLSSALLHKMSLHKVFKEDIMLLLENERSHYFAGEKYESYGL